MSSLLRLRLTRPLLHKFHKRYNGTVTTVIPSKPELTEVKWEVASKPEITGAIIPFMEQNALQWVLFPYTYSVMYYLDFLSGHMPWWLAIVGTTATVRLLFFPLVVKQNIIGIKIYNIMPQTQKLQMKMNEATASGDAYKAALTKTKLSLLYKEHNVSIWERVWPLLVQTPMFMSMFFLLRRLSYHPVEALTTGGAFWFQNLTLPDPYFILPSVACLSTFLMLEYGLEGAQNPKMMGPIGRWFIRCMPIGMFAFVYNFPAAVLLFWATNNVFTLSYAFIMRNKWVKRKLNVPERLVHDPNSLPMTNQTFSSQYRNAVELGRSRKSTMDVRRLDDIAFRKAGIGPLRKTYKPGDIERPTS